MSEFAGLFAEVVELVFPRRCPACDAVGVPMFCAACSLGLETCGSFGLPGLDWAHAAYVYGGPVAEALARFKYRGRWDLGLDLGTAAFDGVHLPAQARIVPVPSTPERLRLRGYNPATELARAAPWRLRRLHLRRRDHGRQVGRTRRQRNRLTADAFWADSRRIRGRDVVIVDDVVTTGATAGAVAEVLRRAGARSIGLVVLARADLIP